jgi:serine/threonine protein kinase/tetratricopeptide (TPR) repeat protein
MREDEILLAALQKQEPAEREAYLRQVCAGDNVLRQRLDELLSAHAAWDIPTCPPPEPPGSVAMTGPYGVASVGQRVGAYKLLQRLGEGGMGTVFLAEQEHPVRRRVALKVIKPGMDSASVIARFEGERQALALMNHSNIAKVLDAGTTPDGRPYFVMELVAGVAITSYCDEHHLSVRQRLELFIPVCQAIQHAHQKGIIHRDIKPSNVLVALEDGRPIPKVIDFGVAKALSQPLVERTLVTELGAIVGTPEYMSPEQAGSGPLDIDTRSDVYALGVLLYELLTGATPVGRERLRRAGYAEMLRLIREEEPQRPSTRITQASDALTTIAAQRQTDPARLVRQVRGELDWIVMKALEKDRGRRYATANGLARDVERHLQGDSVEACPPSAAYRLRKLAYKHRGLLTAVAAFGLLLAAAAAVSTYEAFRAVRAEGRSEAERDRARAAEERARQEAEVARAVKDFLLKDLLIQAEPRKNLRARDITVAELLDRSAAGVPGAFSGRPEVEAAVRYTIGSAYLGLGLHTRAEPHLMRAVDLYREARGADDPDTLMASTKIAVLRRVQGRADLAESLSRQILEARRRLFGDDRVEVMDALLELVYALDDQGKLPEAEALYRQVAQGYRRLPEPDEHRILLAELGLESVVKQQGKLQEAKELGRRNVAAARRVLGTDHPDSLLAIQDLVDVLDQEGHCAEAEPLARSGLEASRRVLGPKHPETLIAQYTLGHLLARQGGGKMTEAETVYRDVLGHQRRILGLSNPRTLNTVYELGYLLYDTGKLPEAEALAREGLAAARQTLSSAHPSLRKLVDLLATVLQGQDKLAEAEALHRENVEVEVRERGPTSFNAINAQNNLGNVLYHLGKVAEAEELLRRVVDAHQHSLDPETPDSQAGMNNLGYVYLARHKAAEAEPLFRCALAMSRKTLGEQSLSAGYSLAGLGSALTALGKPAEAEPLLKQALEIVRGEFPGGHWRIADVESRLAGCRAELGRYAQAEPVLLESYKTLSTARGVRLPRVWEARDRLVRLYEAWGKPDRAAEWRQR